MRLIAAVLLAAAGLAGEVHADAVSAPDLKAAFLLNFVKFAEWPNVDAAKPIVVCVFGDDRVSEALVRTQAAAPGDRRLEFMRLLPGGSARDCQVLFVGEDELRKARSLIDSVKGQPVLTVSDAKRFAESDGIIEFFVENGRMRFAINVESATQARVHLSSRLLGLAKIVRGDHAR